MLQLDRIAGLHVERVTPAWTRDIVSMSIPGGMGIDNADGAQGERYTLRCAIREQCAADAIAKLLQLRELRANMGYPFHYLYFTGQFKELTGWYALVSVNPVDLDGTTLDAYEFDLDVVQKYTAEERRLATHWQVAAETYSGANWAGNLTAVSAISLPNGATNVPVAIALTRTGADGSSQTLENPTRNTIHYQLPEAPIGWYRMEPHILDTQNADSELGWTKAYSPGHHFEGGKVFQNGLLRYVYANNMGTWYVWDNVSSNKSWVEMGVLRVSLTGNLLTVASRVEVLPGYPTSEEIQWSEWRTYNENPVKLTYSLRRGMPFVRVRLQTYSLGINSTIGVRLFPSVALTQFFNHSANGAVGAGNLATDTTHNYHAGYTPARNTIVGFVLLTEPTFQPPNAATGAIPEGNTWSTGDDISFFLFGYPCNISTFNLATERTNCNKIATHCLNRVKQELALVGARQYA